MALSTRRTKPDRKTQAAAECAVVAPRRLALVLREIVRREADGEGLIDILRALTMQDGGQDGGQAAPPGPVPADAPGDDGPQRQALAAENERLAAALAASAESERAALAAFAGAENERLALVVELQGAAIARRRFRRLALAAACVACILAAVAGGWFGAARQLEADDRRMALQQQVVDRMRVERDQAQNLTLEVLDRLQQRP